jgi:hypothetical protein
MGRFVIRISALMLSISMFAYRSSHILGLAIFDLGPNMVRHR